jgi:hypothetical protein
MGKRLKVCRKRPRAKNKTENSSHHVLLRNLVIMAQDNIYGHDDDYFGYL